MARNRKHVVAFIDDDPAELARFETTFRDDFECVTASGYEDMKSKLRERRVRPRLVVLDLYFPRSGVSKESSADKTETVRRYSEVRAKEREFAAYLERIGQGPVGGLALLEQSREDLQTPVIMFTRKGTLEDAMNCMQRGATEVLQKPMPAGDDSSREALDQAMMDGRPLLRDRFAHAIARSSFWGKHKASLLSLGGFALGALFKEVLAFTFSRL